MKNNFFFLISIYIYLSSNLYGVQILTFSKAYDLTLKNSKMIESYDLKVKSSYENIVQAKAQLYPEINLFSSYSSNDYNFKEGYYYEDKKEKIKNYGVNIQQPIFDKTISSQIDVEKAKYKSIDAESNEKKQEFIKDVLKVYLTLIQSQNNIQMYHSQLKYLHYKKEFLTEQYNMNLSTITELLETKNEYNRTNIELEKEKILYKVYKRKMEDYIGEDIDFNLPDLNTSIDISKNLNRIKDTITKNNGINTNYQIQKLQNLVKMYKNEVINAQSYHYPKLTLNLKYTKNIDSENNITVDSYYDEQKSVYLNLVIPVFKGGYYLSKTDASRLNEKASKKELESLEKDLKLQYDEAKTNIVFAIDSAHLYEEAIKTAQLTVDNINKEYSYGLKSKIDLYEANYNLFKLKNDFVKNIATLAENFLSILIITNNFKDLKIIDLIFAKS